MIHSLLCWLDPARVQAVCAVLGVIGLFIYAWDNRRSANYSREQIEEPSIPFVTIDVPTTRSKFGAGRFVLMNVGKGAALNVFLKGVFLKGEMPAWPRASAVPEWRNWMPRSLPYGVIAAGDDAPLDDFVIVAIDERKTFTIEYQSLSGRRYRTVITRYLGGDAAFGRAGWAVQFEKLDSAASERRSSLRRFSRTPTQVGRNQGGASGSGV
jgi:hypothetical protein